MAQNKLLDTQTPAALQNAAAANTSGSPTNLPKSPWASSQAQALTSKSTAVPLQTTGRAERHTKHADLLKNGKRLTDEEELSQQLESSKLSSGARTEEVLLSRDATGTDAEAATQSSSAPSSNNWAANPAGGLQLAQLELPVQPSVGGNVGTAASSSTGATSSFGGLGGVFAGAAALGLAAGGGGGGKSAGSSVPFNGKNDTETEVISGRLINGYINKAIVFQDNDDDGVLDNDRDGTLEAGEEPYTITSIDGQFRLEGANPSGGPLVTLSTADTVDVSTGERVTNVFKAPVNATVISPLSTLIEAGLSEAEIKTAFGIAANTKLLDFDPVNAALTGDSTEAGLALQIKAAGVMVSNLMDVGNSLIQGAKSSESVDFSGAVVNSLVSTIKNSTTPLNLGSSSTVTSILTQAASASGVSASTSVSNLVSATADQLSGTNILLKDKAQSGAANAEDAEAALLYMAKIEKVVQSTVANDVKSVATGSASLNTVSDRDVESQAATVTVPPILKFKTLGFEAADKLTLTAFNGASVASKNLSGNTVIEFTKAAGDSASAAGVTLATGKNGNLGTIAPLGLSSSTETELGMWVNSARKGTRVTLEIGDSDKGGWPNDVNFVAAEAVTTQAGWEYLTFDFAKPITRYVANGNPDKAVPTATPLKSGVTYDMLNVFFDLGDSKLSNQKYQFDGLGYAKANPGPAPADDPLSTAGAIPEGYSLKFSEEFGGDIATSGSAEKASVDATKWTLQTGKGPYNDGWGNGESQTYTNTLDNAYVQNGALHIVAKKVGDTITSARLKSAIDLEPYGYMEVKAKFFDPASSLTSSNSQTYLQGAWPAIWMLGKGTWPDTGEIDVMEWTQQYFNTSEVQAALHFKGTGAVQTYGNTQMKESTTLSSAVTDFHTYQVWWTQDYIRFGVDSNNDNAYYEYKKPSGATAANWPFDNPMDIILNMAIGGTYGGTVPSGNFSYEMAVDYVRVYQGATSQSAPTTAPTAPTAAADDVVSLYSDAYTTTTGFQLPKWTNSQVLLSDVTIASNKVLKGDQFTFQGFQFDAVDATTKGLGKLHLDIWSKDATPVKVYVISEGQDSEFVTVTPTAGAWKAVDIDLSAFTKIDQTKIFQVKLDTAIQPTTKEMYFDNIYFGKADAPAVPTAPTTAPTAPTAAADDVVSLYSDAYTTTTGFQLPKWTNSQVLLSDVTIASNKVLKGDQFTFQGFQFDAVDATTKGLGKLHLDIWSKDATPVKVYVISEGQDSEFVTVTPTAGAWKAVDIDLSAFTKIDQTKIFQVKLDTAIQPTTKEMYFDNIYFGKADAPAVPTAPTTAPTAPTAAADDVVSLYSDAYTTTTGFQLPKWTNSQVLLSDVTIASNKVLKGDQFTFQGFQFDAVDATTKGLGKLHLDIWSKDATPVKVYVISEGQDSEFVTVTPTAGAWKAVDIDLSAFTKIDQTKIFQVKLDTAIQPTTKEMYFDNIYFGKADAPAVPTAPTTAPTAPTAAADDVVSLYSDAYTTTTGFQLPKWTNSQVLLSDVTIASNKVLKGDQFTFQGFQFDAVDATTKGLGKLHLDIWSKDATPVKVYVISEGQDSEFVTVTPTAGAWKAVDIDLSAFTKIDQTKIFQVKLDTAIQPTTKEMYFDNIYFGKADAPAVPTAPTTAPTAPTAAADDVVSLYSDAYTTTTGFQLPKWTNSQVLLSDVTIASNKVLKGDQFTFQGFQFDAVDATTKGLGKLHLDIWSKDATPVKVYVISEGQDSEFVTVTPTAGAWKAVDIDLSAFTKIDQTKIFQVKLDTAIQPTTKEMYFDNIYFGKADAPAVPTAPTTAPTAPTAAADDVVSLYSDAYTTTTGFQLPKWTNSQVLLSDVTIASNKVLKGDQFTFQGFQFDAVDATTKGLGKLHLDIWSKDATPVKVYVISEGQDSEFVTVTPTAGAWKAVDIDLSAFTKIDQTKIFQVKLDTAIQPTTKEMYFDNIYFGKADAPAVPTAPTTAPTAPTAAADDVVSLYSDAYTTTTGFQLPKWTNSQVLLSDVTIASNKVLKGDQFTFQGFQFDAVDATTKGLGKLHLDIWSKDATPVKVYVISEGQDSEFVTVTPTAGAWKAVDIDLSAFTKIDQTKIFQVKLDTAIQPTTKEMYFDNIYFGKADAPAVPTAPTTAPTAPTAAADDVVSLYSDAYTTTTGFQLPKWTNSQVLLSDVTIASNKVLKGDQFTFQGFQFDAVDATTKGLGKLHLDIWSKDATPVKVYVISEGQDSEFVTVTPTAGAWKAVDIDLSAFTKIDQTKIFQVKLDTAIQPTTKEMYFDNIYFGKADAPAVPTAPTTAPTAPTAAADDVVSLYSDAYTTTTGFQLPKWTNSQVLLSDVTIASNKVLKGDQFTFQGFQFDAVDATTKGLGKLHLDIWSKDATPVKVYVISEGQDSEFVTVTPTAGAWKAVDIDLSAFTKIDQTKIFQVKLDTAIQPTTKEMYFDNIYFGKADAPAAPTTAPTAPTAAADDVVSLYSDAYTNVTVDTWSSQWDQADVAEVRVAGNAVKQYSDLNYAIIEFSSNTIDASATNMTHLHLDVWKESLDSFKIKLVDFGANGVWEADNSDNVEAELSFNTPSIDVKQWVGLDIPLADFKGLTSREHLAQLIISGGGAGDTVWLDNIYLYSNPVI